MLWDKIQEFGYKIRLTKNEQAILLFLAITMLFGAAVSGFNTIFTSTNPTEPRFDYSTFDQEFLDSARNVSPSNASKELTAEELDSLANTLSHTQIQTAPTKVKTATPGAAININTASVVDLTSIPGIGRASAERIIAYRSANGKFTSIDELREVKSIGKKKFEKMKEYISVH